MRVLVKKVNEFLEKVGRDHVGAYAAQSAFFLVLSLIPIILLLLTLVRYTPVTKAEVRLIPAPEDNSCDNDFYCE